MSEIGEGEEVSAAQAAEAASPDQDANEVAEAKRSFSKTPLFVANNAARYQRQSLIKEIEERTSRKLLCYVGGNEAEIERDDTVGFVDLLHNIPKDAKIDLVLHTIGGDIDVAEKLIKMVQARAGGAQNIRVIVPDFAKSAGTLMSLGADSIMMSDSSELGAIDPQVVLKDGRGNELCHSVFGYLGVYRHHEEALRKNPNDPVARMMLDKFDPAIVQKFQVIGDRARVVAENLLKRRGLPFSKIASHLLDVGLHKSHNQMISAQDAHEFGLNIEFIDQADPLWETIWQLHCLQRLSIDDKQKLFESYYVSLPM